MYHQVNDLSGYSHGQNIRQMLGMISRYPLLACRVLELEHTFNLADRAYAAAAAKKPRKAAGESKAAGGCDGGGSGAAGSAGALAGSSVGSALPDAGESTEVGTALPVAVEGSEVGTAFTDDSFVDSDDGTPASAGPPRVRRTCSGTPTWPRRKRHRQPSCRRSIGPVGRDVGCIGGVSTRSLWTGRCLCSCGSGFALKTLADSLFRGPLCRARRLRRQH